MKEYISEKSLENYLNAQVLKKGGLSYKWSSPGRRGVPDRIIIFQNEVIFVELKTKHGKLSKLQMHTISNLIRYRCQVKILWGKEDIDEFLKHYKEVAVD